MASGLLPALTLLGMQGGKGLWAPEIDNSLWPCAATCGKLFAMGNKDARKREVRKPPKKKPPKHVVNQAVTQIVYKPAAPKP